MWSSRGRSCTGNVSWWAGTSTGCSVRSSRRATACWLASTDRQRSGRFQKGTTVSASRTGRTSYTTAASRDRTRALRRTCCGRNMPVDAGDQFVLGHRPSKRAVEPLRAYASTWEEEPDESGALVPSAVVFLSNRECPFRCVMCDLWMNTLDATPPAGAVPRQVARALRELPAARWVKLYNAGSFFDPRAIPREDDAAIA